MRTFIFYIHQILLEWSNQRGWGRCNM